MESLVHIELDGARFTVHLTPTAAAGGACRIELADGTGVALRPLTLVQYLEVLERHITVAGTEVSLDAAALGRDVLSAAGVAPEPAAALWQLGLYWATRGSEPLVSEEDGWLRGTELQARLRPWTFAQRAVVLWDSLQEGADGAQELGVCRYLLALLRTVVISLAPPLLDVSQLPSGPGIALLAAAVAQCAQASAVAAPVLDDSVPLHRALAARILKVCQALGWTPSRVWATPAAEIDQLLALLQISQAEERLRPRPGRTRGLADFPDAVVIQFEGG